MASTEEKLAKLIGELIEEKTEGSAADRGARRRRRDHGGERETPGATEEDINKVYEERLVAAKALRNEEAEGTKERIRAEEDIAELQRENEAEIAKLKREIARDQEGLTQEQREKAEKDYAQEIKRIGDLADADAQRFAAAAEGAKSVEENIDASRQAAADLGGAIGLASSYQESLLGGVTTTLDSIISSDVAMAAFVDQLSKTFLVANIGAGLFENVFEATLAGMQAYDEATVSFNKATGAAGEFNHVILDAGYGARALGVDLADASAAMTALHSGLSSFTELQGPMAAQLVSSTAALEEIGVSGATTAANIDMMNKVMGLSIQESKELAVSLGEWDIGISSAQIAEDFQAAAPMLAKFGKEGITVFKNLEKQAKATGVSMSSLTAIAAQFDTFEGAAQAAGKLNAMLGGPLLNSVDLLNASDDQRIEMLRQSVEQSGKSWESMNRFEQQAIASAAGISDMGEAARLFGAQSGSMDDVVEKQKKLEDRAKAAATVQEKLTNMMNAFTAGLEPLVDIIAGIADTINEWIDNNKTLFTWLSRITLAIGAIVIATKALVAIQKLAAFMTARGTLLRRLSVIQRRRGHALSLQEIAVETKKHIVKKTAHIADAARFVWEAATWPVKKGWVLIQNLMTGATQSNTAATLANAAASALQYAKLVLVAAVIGAILLILSPIIILYGLWTAAQWALNIAMDANPIGLIILAVVGLIAAVAGLIIYWDELQAGMASLTGGMFDMWDVLLLLLGPFGTLIIAGKKLYENWDAVVSGLTELWVGFKNFMSGMWKGIVDSAKAPLNALISLFNNTLGSLSIDIPSWIPFVGGETFGIPKIPMLAEGGTITTGGAAIIGEKGPEMLTLPAGAKVTPAAVGDAGGGGSAEQGPTTVVLQLNDREFARAVIKVLEKKMDLRTA